MALWPFVLLASGADAADPMIMQHESIHMAQQSELLVLPFYVLYVGQYVWQRSRGLGHSAAYMAISFEREAYAYDAKIGYLASRKPYAWINFW